MKKIIILFVAILLASSVYAITDLKSFPRDTVIDFKIPCRISDGGMCDSSFNCYLTMSYPNSSLGFNNITLTRTPSSTGYYNTSFANLPIGNYNNVEVYCTNGVLNGTESYQFSVIGDGSTPSQTEGFVYLIVVFICSLVLGLCFWGILVIKGGNTVDNDGSVIHVNNLKYVKILLAGIAYTMLFILAYFGMNISYKILSFDLATNIFSYIFKILLYAYIPFGTLLFVFLAIKFVKDIKINKILSMGGEYRDK